MLKSSAFLPMGQDRPGVKLKESLEVSGEPLDWANAITAVPSRITAQKSDFLAMAFSLGQ
jgi:hypothetical protein